MFSKKQAIQSRIGCPDEGIWRAAARWKPPGGFFHKWRLAATAHLQGVVYIASGRCDVHDADKAMMADNDVDVIIAAPLR